MRRILHNLVPLNGTILTDAVRSVFFTAFIALFPAAAVAQFVTYTLTTADGQGADADTRLGLPDTNLGNFPEMSIKHQPGNGTFSHKPYLRFDLGSLDPAAILDATLKLDYVDSSGQGIYTINVHGLNDGQPGELWDESTITWNNAPGNITTDGQALNPARTTFLGPLPVSIENGGNDPGPDVPASYVGVDFLFSDPDLLAFLQANTENDVVTLILTRQEVSHNNIRVASKESSLDPPRLELTFQFSDVVLEWNSSGDGGNWSDPANWTGLAVPNDPAARALFGNAITSPATITVDADIAVNEITLDNSTYSYTIADDAMHSLTLAGEAVIDVRPGSHTISAPLVVDGSLTKTGAGTLILSGVSNYTGSTTVSGGMLTVTNSSSRCAIPGGNVTIEDGASLNIGGGIAGVNTLNFGQKVFHIAGDGGGLGAITNRNFVSDPGGNTGGPSQLNATAGRARRRRQRRRPCPGSRYGSSQGRFDILRPTGRGLERREARSQWTQFERVRAQFAEFSQRRRCRRRRHHCQRCGKYLEPRSRHDCPAQRRRQDHRRSQCSARVLERDSGRCHENYASNRDRRRHTVEQQLHLARRLCRTPAASAVR